MHPLLPDIIRSYVGPRFKARPLRLDLDGLNKVRLNKGEQNYDGLIKVRAFEREEGTKFHIHKCFNSKVIYIGAVSSIEAAADIICGELSSWFRYLKVHNMVTDKDVVDKYFKELMSDEVRSSKISHYLELIRDTTA